MPSGTPPGAREEREEVGTVREHEALGLFRGGSQPLADLRRRHLERAAFASASIADKGAPAVVANKIKAKKISIVRPKPN